MSFEYKNDSDSVPPEPEQEEIELAQKEFLEQRKAAIKKRSGWFFGIGLFVVLVFLFWMLVLGLGFEAVLESSVGLFFILGLFFAAAGLWGLYEARRMTIADITPTDEAIEFSRTLVPVTPYFSQLMVGGFIFVFIAEVFSNLSDTEMLSAAALLKPETLQNKEYWRILTSAVMHGGAIHIFFNSYAAFTLGNLIESISNRAHVAIVFILSAIIGGIFSCVFVTVGLPSLGASGGIMGMIGFMAVYGYKRKRQLPSDFLRTMIFNIILIAGVGILAREVIDNAAHLGGLLMGAVYGLIMIPGDYSRDPRTVSMPITILGYAAMGIFFATCIFTILLLLEKITL